MSARRWLEWLCERYGIANVTCGEVTVLELMLEDYDDRSRWYPDAEDPF